MQLVSTIKFVRTTILWQNAPFCQSKRLKLTVNGHVQVMCLFFFFSSIFALTSNRENDTYTLLNPNPTYENNSEVRAKVEEKKN